jgi:Holliday junction resolvase
MEDEVDLTALTKKRSKRINSRTKGHNFERKIAEILNNRLKTTEFMRTPGSGAYATTHKLPEHLKIGGDLITPKDFPYLIECKKGYQFKVSDLFNHESEFFGIIYKLEAEAKKYNKSPLLIFQQDRKEILCIIKFSLNNKYSKNTVMFDEYTILRFEDFLDLYFPLLKS